MRRSCSFIVLVAVLQVILCDSPDQSEDELRPFPPPNPNHKRHPGEDKIPRNCWAPPPGINLHQCCPIPKLYPDEVMDSCGIRKPSGDDFNNPPPKPERPAKVHCKEGTCLMQKANLLMANQSIDYEKLRTFIDKWANENPDFTDAILKAKAICARDGGPSGPPVCEQDRVFFCMTSNILWNCNLKELNGCDLLKEHMDECRQYYVRE